MTLAAGLYKSQDQQEQDLTDGPGWTIDDQKPGFFAGLGVAPVLRGIGQGAAAGISMLAHGSAAVGVGAREAALDEAGLTAPQPEEDRAAETERRAREFSKSLIPDPRITGTAANLVQGFAKAATEFTAGSLAGGPLTGATLLGASEGYGHYQDLRDQGVDEATATKSGLLEAMTSGGSALLPMGMPAKWLAGLSTAGTIAAQVTAGAAINTSFGAASRYASAKILADAGYPEQAEQQQPWDATNLLTDAITGMFFGAHAGWHGLKNVDPAHVDPSLRDAAKVVQDRQEVAERAPGVPVDMASAAVHRQALETALGDLMAGKPVDLSDVKTEGATFVRPEIDESAATKIIRDAFAKSGVLDDAAQFDRWLTGDQEIEATTPEPKSQKEVAPPESVKPEPAAEAGAYDVGEEEMSDELRQQFEGLRSKLPADENAGAAGQGKPEESVSRRSSRGEIGEPLTLHRGSPRPLSPEDFKPESFGHQTARPSSGLGVFFTNDKAEAAGYGEVSSHHLAMKNPLEMKSEDVPGFDSIQAATKWREKQRAKGYDGLVIDASHMGGQTWYVPFEHSQVREVGKAPTSGLNPREDMQIVDEHGTPKSAADEHAKAVEAEAQANKEAEPMFNAAVGCEARHQ